MGNTIIYQSFICKNIHNYVILCYFTLVCTTLHSFTPFHASLCYFTVFRHTQFLNFNSLLDEFPTVSETVKAIKLLPSNKAPGSDAIPAEIYKAGGTPPAEKLTVLYNPQVCDHNHRGHLFIVNCWEDPCKSPTEPTE